MKLSTTEIEYMARCANKIEHQPGDCFGCAVASLATEVLEQRKARRHHTWPYTTPSGRTFELPTTYEALVNLHTTAALDMVEDVDLAERCPEPTWEMVGLAHREIERLRAEVEAARGS